MVWWLTFTNMQCSQTVWLSTITLFVQQWIMWRQTLHLSIGMSVWNMYSIHLFSFKKLFCVMFCAAAVSAHLTYHDHHVTQNAMYTPFHNENSFVCSALYPRFWFVIFVLLFFYGLARKQLFTPWHIPVFHTNPCCSADMLCVGRYVFVMWSIMHGHLHNGHYHYY